MMKKYNVSISEEIEKRLEAERKRRGQRIHHNFVKPHIALEGQAPAERAGIKIQGENKWATLIQNASKKD